MVFSDGGHNMEREAQGSLCINIIIDDYRGAYYVEEQADIGHRMPLSIISRGPWKFHEASGDPGTRPEVEESITKHST